MMKQGKFADAFFLKSVQKTSKNIGRKQVEV